jgi:hypothetical protein
MPATRVPSEAIVPVQLEEMHLLVQQGMQEHADHPENEED